MASAPGLRVIDLNRPRVLNALNKDMVGAMLPLVVDWQKPGGDVKVVVLRGAGDRAFCAGGDLLYMHNCVTGQGGLCPADALALGAAESALIHTLHSSRPPVVALLDGVTMGSGAGLSVHGRFRIATENTLFAMPEAGIGYFPDVGSSFFLPRLPTGTDAPPSSSSSSSSSSSPPPLACSPVGMYLGLTGARLGGQAAVRAGVATHFVSSHRLETLEGMLVEFAAQALSKGTEVDPKVLSSAISALGSVDSNKGDAAVEGALKENEAALAACFSLCSLEAVLEAVKAEAARESAAAADTRATDPSLSGWAVRAENELKQASPTSLAVTFELLRRGAKLPDLWSCLCLEHTVTANFLARPPRHNSNGDNEFAVGAASVLGLGTGDGGTLHEEKAGRKKGRGAVVWGPAPSGDELEEYFRPHPSLPPLINRESSVQKEEEVIRLVDGLRLS